MTAGQRRTTGHTKAQLGPIALPSTGLFSSKRRRSATVCPASDVGHGCWTTWPALGCAPGLWSSSLTSKKNALERLSGMRCVGPACSEGRAGCVRWLTSRVGGSTPARPFDDSSCALPPWVLRSHGVTWSALLRCSCEADSGLLFCGTVTKCSTHALQRHLSFLLYEVEVVVGRSTIRC